MDLLIFALSFISGLQACGCSSRIHEDVSPNITIHNDLNESKMRKSSLSPLTP
jgi:hypothetical protein